MVVVWQAGPALSLASGVLMAVLGAVLVRADPRKDWNRIFALLAVFWGIQIIALNLVLIVTERQIAEVAGRVSLAFLIPLYFFIIAFAAVFPRPRAPFGTKVGWLVLAIVPGAATLLLLIVDPGSIIRDIVAVPSTGTFTVIWGTWFPYLVLAPLYAAFFYALYVMIQRLGEAGTAIERSQIAFVLAAIGLFVAYNTPLQLLLFGGRWVGLQPASEAQRAEATLIGLVMLVGMAVLVYLAVRLARSARAGASPVRQEARSILLVLGVAFALGVFEGALFHLDGPRLRLVGAVRLVSVALIVYAISRYQLFDLHLRIRIGATALTTVLVVASLGAALWVGMRDVGLPVPVGTALVVTIGLLLFVPLLRLASRLVDRIVPRPTGSDDLYLRKLDVYRASVEAMVAGGDAPPRETPPLVALRARLGLGDEDHDVVARLVVDERRPQPVTLHPGVRVFDRYEIDAVLGEGSVGRVFSARDTLLGRRVVLKQLLSHWRDDPALSNRLLHEARVAGRLQHPNIVAVFDVERSGEDHFLVLEHLDGGSLAERLSDAAMPPKEVAAIVSGVLDGLAAAHGQGIVHRDIKPDNVLFAADGTVKVADFGIAAAGGVDPETTLVGLPTGPRASEGTLAYMSPEQAQGGAQDARSDLYAVGLLTYRLLTGRPFHDLAGRNEMDARDLIAAASAPTAHQLASCPVAWRPVIAQALAPRPEDRFTDAATFAQVVRATVADGGRTPRARGARRGAAPA